MKKLFYVVEKELEDIDGVQETTGYKDIRLYDIVDNVPKLVDTISAENEYSTLDELKCFVEETIQAEDYETHLDKTEEYVFEQL